MLDGTKNKRALTTEQEETLQKILNRHRGKITAEKLLEVVERDGTGNPLHGVIFDVGASGAARKYYLARARWVLRHSTVKLERRGEPKPVEIRRTVHLRSAPIEAAYVETKLALGVPEYRAQLRDQCRRDFRQFLEKWTAILGKPFVESVIEAGTADEDE